MNVTQFKISTTLLVVCFTSQLFSDNQSSSLQAPFTATTFAKRIRGTGSLVDTIQTADKSYVSVSRINSEGKVRSFLVRKIASSGRRVWERILRLQVELSASLNAITQTTDGGYILAGQSLGCSPSVACWEFLSQGILIKLRSNGTVVWKREYSTSSNLATFKSLVSTADGGVIVTGTTAYGAIILARYTSTGSILWSKSFPNLRVNVFPYLQLVQTPNNSLILVANAGALVIKVNEAGGILWKKSLQMPNLSVQTIAATSDNGIILAGSCKRNCKQLFVVRLKADGSVQSKLRYSLQVARVGSVTDIIQTSDGGFTITGSVDDTENRSRVFVAKIDSKGKASFQRTFHISGFGEFSVFALSHGYLLFGSTDRDTIILKLDSQGLRPGCGLVSSAAIAPIPFGNLRISQRQISAAADLSLGTSDLAGSSIAARRPESDLCP
jgi:hypothetical protein